MSTQADRDALTMTIHRWDCMRCHQNHTCGGPDDTDVARAAEVREVLAEDAPVDPEPTPTIPSPPGPRSTTRRGLSAARTPRRNTMTPEEHRAQAEQFATVAANANFNTNERAAIALGLTALTHAVLALGERGADGAQVAHAINQAVRRQARNESRKRTR